MSSRKWPVVIGLCVALLAGCTSSGGDDPSTAEDEGADPRFTAAPSVDVLKSACDKALVKTRTKWPDADWTSTQPAPNTFAAEEVQCTAQAQVPSDQGGEAYLLLSVEFRPFLGAEYESKLDAEQQFDICELESTIYASAQADKDAPLEGVADEHSDIPYCTWSAVASDESPTFASSVMLQRSVIGSFNVISNDEKSPEDSSQLRDQVIELNKILREESIKTLRDN